MRTSAPSAGTSSPPRWGCRAASRWRSWSTGSATWKKRLEEERRLRRDALAAAVLSVGAVPIGFLLGFFGINTSQVTGEDSVFDFAHYWWVYAFAILLANVPVRVFTYLHGRVWLRSLFSRRPLHPWRR